MPALVAVFEVDFSIAFQVRFDQLGELADIIVVGLVGNAEPRIGVKGVGQLDLEFQCYARFTSLRRLLERRSIGPVRHLRVIGHPPVHETNDLETVPAFQEIRIEGLLPIAVLEAGQQHADIANRILRFGL